MPDSNAISNMLSQELSAKVKKFSTVIEQGYPLEIDAIKEAVSQFDEALKRMMRLFVKMQCSISCLCFMKAIHPNCFHPLL